MRGLRSRVAGAAIGIAFASALLPCARPARAQDTGMSPPRESGGLGHRLGLETTWATFDLGGARGDYYGVTARLDVRASHILSLRLLVPVYAIALDGQPTRAGPGDAELRVRVMLLDADDWRLYAGLSDQLPTGDNSIGVGQGGTQLTPFLTGGWRRGSVVVYGVLADALGLHSQGSPPALDYVDPSADHELRASVGLIGELGDVVYFNVLATQVTVLTPGDLGETLAYGGVAAGFMLGDRTKLVLSGQAPIAGQHRFDSKVGLAAYVSF